MNKMVAGLAGFIGVAAVIGIASVSYVRGHSRGGIGFDMGLGNVSLSNVHEFLAEGINSIHIEYSSPNVYFYEGERDKIVVKEYLAGDGKSEVKVDGDALSIVGADKGVHISLFTFGEEKVEVYLPEDYRGSVRAAVSSGNIKTEDALQLKEFAVTAKSGNISCGEVVAEEITAVAESGNITFEKAQGNRKMETKSGNIKLGGGEGATWVSAESGNITVAGAAGGFYGAANSGNVKAEFIRIGDEDIAAETKSGNIQLELPRESAFTYMGSTSSGTIKTDFDEMLTFNEKRDKAKGSFGSRAGASVCTEAHSGNIRIVLK